MTAIASGLITPDTTIEVVTLDAVVRLAKEIRGAAGELARPQILAMVKIYYQYQDGRIAAAAQARAARDAGRSDLIQMHFYRQTRTLETQARAILGEWALAFESGQWLQAQYGIGPVISAGLLAHLDIHRAPSVGHWWSFAGSNPQMTWEKGQRRPFNAELKSLCWRMVDSMVKHRNDVDDAGAYKCFYGRHYDAKKAQLVERDQAGGFAELAAETLKIKNIRDQETLDIYQSGHIPPGRIDAQARRWTWKLILSHLHRVMCFEYGIEPPKPYVITHFAEHVHEILPPNYP